MRRPPPPPPEPSFYVATAPLLHGSGEAVAVVAYQPGDRVSPGALERNPQWRPLVAAPPSPVTGSPSPRAGQKED